MNKILQVLAKWLGGAFLAQLASSAFKKAMIWLAAFVNKPKSK